MRADVVAAARSLIGTPFHHQGRVPGVGIDCAGVLIVVARLLGIKPPDFDVNGYARTPDGLALRALCEEHMERVTELEPGDVALIRWKSDERPHHLGIVGDHPNGLSLIHAESRSQNKVIESRLEFGRYMRLVQAYRFP